jgi:hypothetical protein
MTAKACFKCDEVKPLTEFYRHSAMADGHLNKCKDCACKDVRQHRLDNPEKVRAYDRKRSQQPHRVEARRASYLQEWDNHPDRMRARNAVSNAVRDGRLEKRPCAFCGEAEGLEAHHHDYTKPLDVTWLCRPCHRRFHALERMATYRDDKAA